MPIYEYVCEQCGHGLEALQKLSDSPLSDCPECESAALKKKISASGFRLSGSGWYETDFKSDKQKNLAKGDSTEKSSGESTTKAGKDSSKPRPSGKEAAA